MTDSLTPQPAQQVAPQVVGIPKAVKLPHNGSRQYRQTERGRQHVEIASAGEGGKVE